eukprot:TRINITY_DN535_c0_g2_i1.p1 TRINITY_DN535_c0_g2~~TRINITY_DN535_c0_g2_i1.p1  ORF type:complete len:747 (+),score=270.81 TRINITY_DN535_c0_g2_i1:86-2242(+)
MPLDDPFGADNPFAKPAGAAPAKSAAADPFAANDPFSAAPKPKASAKPVVEHGGAILNPFAEQPAAPPAPAPAPPPEEAPAVAAPRAGSPPAPPPGQSLHPGPPAAAAGPAEDDPFSAGSPPVSPVPKGTGSVAYAISRALPGPSSPGHSPGGSPRAGAAAAFAAAAQRSGAPAAIAGDASVLSMDKDQWKEAVVEACQRMRDAGAEQRAVMIKDAALAAARRPEHRARLPDGAIEEASRSPEGVQKLLMHLRLSEHARPFVWHNRVEVLQATRHSGSGFANVYWAYTFRVYTTLSPYQDQPHYDGMVGGKDYTVYKGMTIFNLERRYSHFEWLRKALMVENPGCVVPPVPPKTVQSYKDKSKGDDGDCYRVGDLEEAARKKGAWQPDAQVTGCNLCKKEFGLIRRRHHCRHCALIFCDDCCPKGPTGSRKCKDCLSLKGIGQFLADHPDVAFRMRYLHQFLVTCFAGPLSESPTLRFFVEAPLPLLEGQMEAKLKELTHKRDNICERSIKDKIAGTVFWEKECTGQRKGDLSPRSVQRRDWGLGLLLKGTEYDKVKKDLHKQLTDNLTRQRPTTAPLPEHLHDQQDLVALQAACDALDDAVVDFRGPNKELLFNLSADMAFLADLMRAGVEALGRVEEYQAAKKRSKEQQQRLVLESVLDQHMSTVAADISWLRGFHGASLRRFFKLMWQYESQRDPCLFEWAALAPFIERIQVPPE